MITGSCLCGAVTYTITGKVGDIVHCHCVTCRKAHAAAFSSVAAVADADFVVSGRESLTAYESSPGKQRYFCSRCGCQIYAKRDNTKHLVLRLGSLDDHPGVDEKCHIWVSEKAEWYDINSTLPVYPQSE
ncbi:MULTISPECIES: GFA family protein [unclassified Oceanobacter]|uniref:GFA family protein n=2 Tax=Gammaproteobacteria TaxID=1236 RepID=UPI0027375BE4|nr:MULTISPECIES: GFA family protein [unclassified Oceanobacter]MDP2506257.1 GFA family protein [Oceanobacter sp. 3_MG-2023]MDP2609809.1 GFA family protein [Oceanobacter sp. 1_MG-2023]MDP2613140.1 GFA family protein [Oceanobacter sp. 2_MG-2023]